MIITYREAIHRAMIYALEHDLKVFAMGLGIDDHKGTFGTTKDLADRFGKERVFDTPISEAAMTGIAIGAALGGFKPIHIHIRNDFLYLAMDQLLNQAAKWHYMFGGQMNVPMVVRAIIGRSWGQGAQHSQSLQSFFMHVPGIKVVMPTSAYDAYGLLSAAIRDPNPVVILEHRLLYDILGEVPNKHFEIPLKKAFIRKNGEDLTIIANSHMVAESLKAAEFLEQFNIHIEIVDPVTLVPIDEETILNSVKKTGKALVIDSSWTTCGASAEIASILSEKAFNHLKQPIKRMGMKPTTCPVSKPLEHIFYPNAKSIVSTIFSMMNKTAPNIEVPLLAHTFKGPF